MGILLVRFLRHSQLQRRSSPKNASDARRDAFFGLLVLRSINRLFRSGHFVGTT